MDSFTRVPGVPSNEPIDIEGDRAMRTFVRIVAGTFGITALVLFAGSREADAAPRRISACIEVRVGSLAVGCEERGDGGQLVDADVVHDATGQATVCGNAVGVLGGASASCDGGQDAGASGGGDSSNGWIDADVIDSATVQGVACGNAVGVGGDADARCDGRQEGRGASRGDGDRRDALIDVDVLRWGLAAQATACGNSVAVLGESTASCRGSQGVGAESGFGQGQDDAAVLGGPVTVQATACGNTVAALGQASASCEAGQPVPAAAGGGSNGDEDEAAVVRGPAAVQATACGNTVAALGGATASCGAADRAPAGGVGGGGGVPEAPPITELPQAPGTAVLGAGGAGPGGVAAGSGFIPQTGRSTAGLVRAATLLLAAGIGGLVAGRRQAPAR
jgi:hypothetical protein